jgi:hypothetical protein
MIHRLCLVESRAHNAFPFTFAIQVYGGAISVIIGAYVWSEIGSGRSNATSGDTYCSDCGVLMSGISIINSDVKSITSGGVCSLLAFCSFHFLLLFFVCYLSAVSSTGLTSQNISWLTCVFAGGSSRGSIVSVY